ncbi:Activator heat shock protein ATPase 1 [Merluccius polli]|uniref:Activator heat shock protein ATPase 1 n=1 Tax=Merluccius polli TaxID=89951 RepID=A0AA47P0C1_MERPO|nr:Activator heat shock protein ATPase 1 [Merluccius polli]
MAKWGEGDPRWIVEERADATNVNNWHWTERDATNWSSDKLKSLLMGLSVENEEGACEVTEVGKVEGEASINNRKGKLIFFYEWTLKATWTGTSKSGIKYKGSIDVPNLSDENDMEDLDINITLNKDEPETPLTALMKTRGAERLREVLGSYVGFLKTEFTQGMILPTANGVSKPQSSQSKTKLDKTQISSGSTVPPPNTGVKIPTCKFSMRETFLTSPPELYRVFLNQEERFLGVVLRWYLVFQMVQAFTHASASLEAEKGGRFRLLDGNVLGEFTELSTMRPFSLTLSDRASETALEAEFRGVPATEEERTRLGWQRYYFEAIKQTFGFGARLY